MHKLILKNILLLAALITLGACASHEDGYRLHKITSCNFPDNPSQKAPVWLCSYSVQGYSVIGIGSVAKSKAGQNFMMQQATAIARANITQELASQINSEIRDYMSVKGTDAQEVDHTSSSLVHVVAKHKLTGAKIIRTTVSNNGTLYVLVGLTPEAYKANLQTIFLESNHVVNTVDSQAITNKLVAQANEKNVQSILDNAKYNTPKVEE